MKVKRGLTRLSSWLLQCTVYICLPLYFLPASRQTELIWFLWNTNRQTTINCFQFISLCYSSWRGRAFWAETAGSTLWPLTRPEGEVQVRWLAGRVGRDCSKLAVGRFADAEQGCWCSTSSLGLSVWAQSASTSSCQPACLFVFELGLKDKSGDIFFLLSTDAVKRPKPTVIY